MYKITIVGENKDCSADHFKFRAKKLYQVPEGDIRVAGTWSIKYLTTEYWQTLSAKVRRASGLKNYHTLYFNVYWYCNSG